MLLPFILITTYRLAIHNFSSVQWLSRVWLFVTPWTAAPQAFLSISSSWSLLKLMSIESVMPSNHLILCRPLLLPPSIFLASGSFPMSQFFTSGGQSIGVSASASVLPMNIQDRFPLGWTVGSPCSPKDSQESSTPQFKKINNLTVYFVLSRWTLAYASFHCDCVVSLAWLMYLYCYFLYLQIHLYAILIQPSEMIPLRISSLLSQILCESVTIRISSVQLLSRVWLFATPWTTALQASLSITNSQTPPKPMSICWEPH